MPIDDAFVISPSELTLRFTHPAPPPLLTFSQRHVPFEVWRQQCRHKLAELLHVSAPPMAHVTRLRETVVEGVRIAALRMDVAPTLSIPAYFLQPLDRSAQGDVVMALHGHGEVDGCIGQYDDYHHQFALTLAQHGHRVLCPELRGFGALRDVALDLDGYRLDYWAWGSVMAYSLVTDAFLHGHTLLGATIEDVLRWEAWLARERAVERVQVVGISYGGDLALAYAAFSRRVDRIFASGTLGSFDVIFARAYNAPAHCVPHLRRWMDRADIAGLNAPRPLLVQYGERDTPGEGNYSAAYNETVAQSVADVRRIYQALGAADQVHLVVTPGLGHEMDLDAVVSFLAPSAPAGSTTREH